MLVLIQVQLVIVGDGPLTVTDANVMVGKLQTAFFPKIFGPQQNEPLDYDAVEKIVFQKLAKKVRKK